jgi:predicted CXXCH cytochrome family protein
VHEARNLSCSTCHSVHHPQSAAHQLVKATETQLCATCHRTQVAKTERAVAHMPVREGKMACTTCHNPHGSLSNEKALRTGSSVAEMCTSCHTEMRGPVLWEHTPVRENCATCHDPHGSSNDRMLVVRRAAHRRPGREDRVRPRHPLARRPARACRVHRDRSDRQTIPFVRTITEKGTTKEYVVEGTTPETLAAGTTRTMDCIDCHNAAAHRISPTAEQAVNRAMAAGRISSALPFVRREAVDC